MRQIIFVDDDANILAGLRRMLAGQRQHWGMRFANSGHEALQMLDEMPADVVVTDMRMPKMDGAALLERVRETMPRTARIVLSGHADENAALRSIGVAQQFLAKPCDAEVLKSTIQRACAIRDSLSDCGVQEAIGSVGELPTLPDSYRRLSAELAEPEPDLRLMADIVAGDMAMTAKILQLVNSAFFGLPRKITKVHDAVVVLGLRTLRALVLQAHAFGSIADPATEPLLRRITTESLLVGRIAARLLRNEGASQHRVEETLHAGLLHDVGELVIAARMPARLAEIEQLMADEGISAVAAQRRVLGADHAQIGGYLLSSWGMSDNIVSAVLYHHHPAEGDTTSFTPTLALHVAQHLLAEIGAVPSRRGDLDLVLLRRLGLDERLEDWRETVAQVLSTFKEHLT